MKHDPTPKLQMAGKGAPTPSLFGVIGKTTYSGYTKSLGGLVSDTKTGGNSGLPKAAVPVKGIRTEQGILGKNATKISQLHYGQVPYQGRYFGPAGTKVA
jgi:hypothetical protein